MVYDAREREKERGGFYGASEDSRVRYMAFFSTSYLR